jgi:sialic acid synthase SpsE
MRKIRIIAEPANYWHGDETLLMATCFEAIACQADFFKLQLYNPEKLGNTWKRFAKKYELTNIKEKLLKDIVGMCDNYGGEALCTIHTTDRVAMAFNQGITNIKIASGQVHPALIDAFSRYKWERVFVSTGMIEDPEDLNHIESLRECTKELVIMHAVSLYPVTDVEANISRIHSLREVFPNVSLGYSDHLMDDLACVLSMGVGADYVEKHFKIDGAFGHTSEIATDSKGLSTLCSVRKRVERMWGDGRLTMQDREFESSNHYKTRYLLDVAAKH